VITRWTLRWLRFDTLGERIGLAALLKAADLPPASVLAGSAVFWLVWLGFLLSGIPSGLARNPMRSRTCEREYELSPYSTM
jgi:hypothetical protein